MNAADLNDIEFSTLRELLAGKTNGDIARAQGVTVQAVHLRTMKLRKRIGIRTSLQLGAWAERHGIREGQG